MCIIALLSASGPSYPQDVCTNALGGGRGGGRVKFVTTVEPFPPTHEIHIWVVGTSAVAQWFARPLIEDGFHGSVYLDQNEAAQGGVGDGMWFLWLDDVHHEFPFRVKRARRFAYFER